MENEKNIGLELERGPELYLQKIETNYHSSSLCVFYNALLLMTLKEHL
jgi:hypothetical protein